MLGFCMICVDCFWKKVSPGRRLRPFLLSLVRAVGTTGLAGQKNDNIYVRKPFRHRFYELGLENWKRYS